MAGRSTLLVPVAAAESVVGRWRERYDRWAAVPAHITVFAPFQPPRRFDAGTVFRLGAVAARHEPFSIVIATLERHGDGLRLLPERVDKLRELGADLAAEWPDVEGAGRHPDRRFHLSVGRTEDEAELGRMEAAIAPELPISATIDELVLFVRGADVHDRRDTPRPAGRFRLGRASR